MILTSFKTLLQFNKKLILIFILNYLLNMPMTNAERQKKFRERQLKNNRDEYLNTQSQYKKKQYRKKQK